MEIVPIKVQTDKKIAELFDDLKKLVEGGNIEAMAFVAIERDATINTGWSGARAAHLLGGVARLAHLVNLHMDD